MSVLGTSSARSLCVTAVQNGQYHEQEQQPAPSPLLLQRQDR